MSARFHFDMELEKPSEFFFFAVNVITPGEEG